MSDDKQVVLVSLEFKDDRFQSDYPQSVSRHLANSQGILTTQVVVRLGSGCTVRIRIGQESFPFIRVHLLGFLGRQAVPDTTANESSASDLCQN